MLGKRGRDDFDCSDDRISDPRSSSGSHSDEKDDTIGHVDFVEGETINKRYIAQSELGTGTFGKVLKCYDTKYKDIVAIKVIRCIPKYVESAEIEKEILNDVYEKQKKHRSNFCVKLYSTFKLNGHLYMVFEPLGLSILSLIQKNDYTGFPPYAVKAISKQILQAIDFLESMNLIHTDLKLENILFISNHLIEDTVYCHKKKKHKKILIPSKFDIKLIDFGGATYDDAHKTTIINTRQYRAPEVILEIGWSFPSDIWSIGCIMAEIIDGELLFATHDNLEHLALMERILEPFSRSMIDSLSTPLRRKYFDRDYNIRLDKLSKSNYKHVQSVGPLEDMISPPMSSSRDSSVHSTEQEEALYQLLRGLLRVDPWNRYTSRRALKSTYFNS